MLTNLFNKVKENREYAIPVVLILGGLTIGILVFWFRKVLFDLPSTPFAITAVTAILVGVLWPKREKKAVSKPVVHAWARGHVTAACAKADFEIADMDRDRFRLVPKKTFLSTHTASRRMAYFADDPKSVELLGDFLTGTMADFQRLSEWCRIQKSEMLIIEQPERGYGVPINLDTFHRLILDDASNMTRRA